MPLPKKPNGQPADENPNDQNDDNADDSENEDDSSEGNEGDDSNDQGGNDDSSDGGDNEQQVFMSPPEDKRLLPTWKKLQASFNRKMQLAGQVVSKANALDELRQMPSFQSWLKKEQAKRNGRNSSNDDSEEDESSDDDGDDDTPITAKSLKKMLGGFRENLLSDIGQREQLSEKKKQYQKSAEAFKKANPDWKMYVDDINSIMRNNPDLDYDEALLLIKRRAGDDIVDRRQNLNDKKGANSQRPSSSDGKPKGKKKKAKNIFEALEMAQEEHGIEDW